MPRRKSLARQLFEERLRRQRDKERLGQARARHELATQREKRYQQRERQRAKDAAARGSREQARAQERRDDAQKRQYEQILAEQGAARAAAKTADVTAAVNELEDLLKNRNRRFTSQRPYLVQVFEEGGEAEFSSAVEAVLADSGYPAAVAVRSKAHYKPEARELLVDCELPRQDALPAITGYQYIKSKKELRPTPRKGTDSRRLYGRLVARVALRVIREALDASPPGLVDTVAMNGHVSAVDRATGKPIRPCLISVVAERGPLDDLHLDSPELDPQLCLGHLNAIVSPHPYDLEAVRPVVQFDLSKYKFVEEMQVVAGLDSRPDLLALKPIEFEHLARELFEATGMESWVTQASRDDGVDAVATNTDPLIGGLCVIQAKRYSAVVGLEAVHALAGVMNDKHAAKGILVTTSWFGKASYDFAARHGGRIELIDGRKLKYLLRQYLEKDVLIGLSKLPRGWTRDDIGGPAESVSAPIREEQTSGQLHQP